MTALEMYNTILIEINKSEAPSMLLEDYVYIMNKAVQQYTNQIYNRYDLNQQTTDDLSALKRTARLEIKTDTLKVMSDADNNATEGNGSVASQQPVFINYNIPCESSTYYCELPNDYLHMLNCVVEFNKNKDAEKISCKCPKKEDKSNSIVSLCRRMTADEYPSIINNYYFKPSYKRPYFFINQFNDGDKSYISNKQNRLKQKMDIRCGDTSKFIPKYAYIDYLKTPDKIDLTWDQVNNMTSDNSQELEFPEYVCYEIINYASRLILENASDARTQSHIALNQTIGDMASTAKSK